MNCILEKENLAIFRIFIEALCGESKKYNNTYPHKVKNQKKHSNFTKKSVDENYENIDKINQLVIETRKRDIISTTSKKCIFGRVSSIFLLYIKWLTPHSRKKRNGLKYIYDICNVCKL